jgi:hypothetical protein
VYEVNFVADYKGEISEPNDYNNIAYYGAKLFPENANQ